MKIVLWWCCTSQERLVLNRRVGRVIGKRKNPSAHQIIVCNENETLEIPRRRDERSNDDVFHWPGPSAGAGAIRISHRATERTVARSFRFPPSVHEHRRSFGTNCSLPRLCRERRAAVIGCHSPVAY